MGRATKGTQGEPQGVARIDDLERRVVQLEARLRWAIATLSQGKPSVGRPKRAGGRARPRCPGCTLELPKGRRPETCVWCGFRFDAVRGLLR